MADILSLANETAGYNPEEEVYTYAFVQENSVHGNSGANRSLFVAKRNGRIVDVILGTVAQGVSASGWVSGTVTADVVVNSAAVCSTQPAIALAGSAGAVARKSTNNGGGTSAVLTAASANFSTGDHIAINYDARSVGSAAAGAAGTGLYVSVRVRYAAV